MIEQIRKELFALQDLSYREFHSGLMPTVDPETIIGVRTPQLRALAKKLKGSEGLETFLADLPHRYYEENNLHAFLIEQMRDYDRCIAALEKFLPCVDNWATCDMMRPRCFAKHTEELLEKIREWIASPHTYTVRFAIEMLMTYYLDGQFEPRYPEMVSRVRSGEYYINMMIAWYFATALAKQYDSVIGYIEENRLPLWVHNKTIQKAVESRRVEEAHKAYLRTLRRRDVPVRGLTQAELPEALALVWRVFSQFEAPEYAPEGVAEFRRFLDNAEEIGKLRVYGAFDNACLVGVLAMRGSHISLFFVDAAWHRRGVGRKLFETMRAEVGERRFTVNSSPYAVEVYERLGFAATGGEQVSSGIRYTPMMTVGE